MTRVGQALCYLCGEPSSGPEDHVPPQVLFRGATHDYRSPDVLRVPSCRAHNAEASQNDEMLAWVLLSGTFSNAGLDVHQALMRPVIDRVHSDRQFADSRLAHSGTRILRDPMDYDKIGHPRPITYDADYVERSEQNLKERWSICKQAIGKMSAGLFHHATGGTLSLGLSRVDGLRIVVPDFKQCEPTVTPTATNIDEKEFFAAFDAPGRNSLWKSIESGSPDVFRCDINWHRGSQWRFALRMCFYGDIRVWVSNSG